MASSLAAVSRLISGRRSNWPWNTAAALAPRPSRWTTALAAKLAMTVPSISKNCAPLSTASRKPRNTGSTAAPTTSLKSSRRFLRLASCRAKPDSLSAAPVKRFESASSTPWAVSASPMKAPNSFLSSRRRAASPWSTGASSSMAVLKSLPDAEARPKASRVACMAWPTSPVTLVKRPNASKVCVSEKRVSACCSLAKAMRRSFSLAKEPPVASTANWRRRSASSSSSAASAEDLKKAAIPATVAKPASWLRSCPAAAWTAVMDCAAAPALCGSFLKPWSALDVAVTTWPANRSERCAASRSCCDSLWMVGEARSTASKVISNPAMAGQPRGGAPSPSCLGIDSRDRLTIST